MFLKWYFPTKRGFNEVSRWTPVCWANRISEHLHNCVRVQMYSQILVKRQHFIDEYVRCNGESVLGFNLALKSIPIAFRHVSSIWEESLNEDVNVMKTSITKNTIYKPPDRIRGNTHETITH